MGIEFCKAIKVTKELFCHVSYERFTNYYWRSMINLMIDMKNNTEQIKYFLYARKSSEDNVERQMQSLESQERELEKVAKTQKLKIVDIIREEKSAHEPGRQKFNEMMKRIEKGEASGILTWHPNRLSRNPIDTGMVIYAIDREVLKIIKTPTKNYGRDSTDQFVLGLEFGIAKKDSDDKSQVVKRGLLTKCEKGSMPGVAPLGYLNTTHLVGGSRYIVKDPERFELVKKAWGLMASGQHSVSDIQEIMSEKWGFRTREFKSQRNNRISLSNLYRIFNDTFYYGWFRYPRNGGQLWKGAHESMISEETFNIVQALFRNETKARPKKKGLFAFTGIMRCGECGAQITAEEKWKRPKNGKVHHYIYYGCTKNKKKKP